MPHAIGDVISGIGIGIGIGIAAADSIGVLHGIGLTLMTDRRKINFIHITWQLINYSEFVKQAKMTVSLFYVHNMKSHLILTSQNPVDF